MSVVVWGVMVLVDVVCGGGGGGGGGSSGGVGSSGLCDGVGVGRSDHLCENSGSGGSWLVYVVFCLGAS